jgi:hypothetical protein
VQCQDSPKLVKNIRGQWWLAMGASCWASTSSWEIVSKGKEAVEDETVVVSVHTNVTAWTGEAFNFTLDTPAPLQSVTSDIMQAWGNQSQVRQLGCWWPLERQQRRQSLSPLF